MKMICKDRDTSIHEHGWGYERWIANSELYCGKLLVLYRGLECSVHYHKNKHETFYIQEGLLKMRVWEEPFEVPEGCYLVKHEKNRISSDPKQFSVSCEEFLMRPGDRLVVPRFTPHQFVGVDPKTTIIEISTQHFEEDSYRIVRGS
jgi:mannose-6-phosphate isomerase-like protein (cupin superfamily)